VNPRRGPVLVVVLVALLVAVVVGNAAASSTNDDSGTDVATMPNAGTRSTAWFCPGAPNGFTPANETLTLSNVGSTDTDVAMTVYPDGGKPPVQHAQRVAAHTVRPLRRADLGPAGPVVVEGFGRDIVVEAGIQTGNALALTPCATRAATHWLFAAGATPRGVNQWLVIDDPFAADAKVDVLLRTTEGLRQPQALQGLDVARRSRVIIPIHEHAVRQNLVAVEIRAIVGQVVAEQTLVFGRDSGPTGVAVSQGATDASGEWWFADGRTAAGVDDSVIISNVGTADADVDIQGYPDGAVALGPISVTLQRDAVIRVPIGGCRGGDAPCVPVPANTGYALQVRGAGSSVVAEILGRDGTQSDPRGAMVTTGVSRPATSWVFGRSRVAGEQSALVAFTNPSSTEAHVDITLVHDGVAQRPAALQNVRVPGGRRVAVSLANVAQQHDAAVVITADRPVVAERTIAGLVDLTRTAGVTVR
jgi:hypothetical protein